MGGRLLTGLVVGLDHIRAPAGLLETVPWLKRPHAEAVRASIAAHDPADRPAPVTADHWIAAEATDE